MISYIFFPDSVENLMQVLAQAKQVEHLWIPSPTQSTKFLTQPSKYLRSYTAESEIEMRKLSWVSNNLPSSLSLEVI